MLIRRKVVLKVEIAERMKNFINLITYANKPGGGESRKHAMTTDMEESDRCDRNYNGSKIIA